MQSRDLQRGSVALAATTALVCALYTIPVTAAGLDAISTPEQAQTGAALYAEKCTGCHSADLGEGGHGPPLKGEYFWTTWGGQSARKLYGTVISTMPASDPGSLSPADTLALVAFILRANGYPPGTTPLAQPADLQDIVITKPGL
jgi:mono/diheme cytochrome c family protein